MIARNASIRGTTKLQNNGFEQIFLGLEIEVEQALADARTFGDVVDARRRHSPRSAKASRAAAVISSGRSSLRRRKRGSGIAADLVLTRLVSSIVNDPRVSK